MPSELNSKTDAFHFNCFVLGRAQDGGVPHIGCAKACCAQARVSGHQEFPTCLGIHDTQTDKLLLIEATPAIESQVALLRELSGVDESHNLFDALLLTHAHIGHYAGLMQLGKECATTHEIPTYVTTRMGAFLTSNAPWSQLVEDKNIELHIIEPSVPFSPLNGLTVEAIQVPHREDFSDTIAFKIYGPNLTLLFVPDIDCWGDNEQLFEHLLTNVDIAYIDATFYNGRELPNRDVRSIPHPLMIDSMDILQKFADSKPGAVRFIHLNHTNPAFNDSDIQTEIMNRGFRIAEQGDLITL